MTNQNKNLKDDLDLDSSLGEERLLPDKNKKRSNNKRAKRDVEPTVPSVECGNKCNQGLHGKII